MRYCSEVQEQADACIVAFESMTMPADLNRHGFGLMELPLRYAQLGTPYAEQMSRTV